MSPWTPVEEWPLHSPDESDGDECWWACEYPERPADGNVLFGMRCRACALASWADVLANPGARVIETVWGPAAARAASGAQEPEFTRAILRERHGIIV